MNKKAFTFKIYRKPHLEFFWQDKMSLSFPAHFHKHYVIGCLLRGERLYSCSSQCGKLKPLTLMLINPWEWHKCVANGKAKCSWLALHFPIQSMTGLMEKLGKEKSIPYFSQRICPDNKALEKFFNLAQNTTENNAKALITHLLSYAKVQRLESLEEEKNIADHFHTIWPEDQLNFSQKVTLTQMADKMQMNKFSFLRKFKKFTGLSPYRYLCNLRLNRAREALYAGEELSSCAQINGFYDQSHLSHQFTENFGISPGRLRQEALRAFKES